MSKVYSKGLDQTLEVQRYIGKIKGKEKGASVIFIAGIHGNEPSGVFAIHEVLQQIESAKFDVSGNLYALAGNLWALERGKRYDKKDLNRLWTEERMNQIDSDKLERTDVDTAQQLELFEEIQKILATDEGPFYFMDLHTTSSETAPFLTVNDSLLNRRFTQQFPCATILGIEEYLDGPLLSYVNELGYVSFGFEGGQHDSLASIEHHVSFIYLSLFYSGLLTQSQAQFNRHFNTLKNASLDSAGIYEIYFRYAIKPGELFEMKPGYDNFQYIDKGELLANSEGKPIVAEHSARVFMPLYQSQGEDGFFAIRPIPTWAFKLSKIFRNWKLDRLLPILPGVRWATSKKDSLLINKSIAKVLVKEIMHLMGYRSRLVDMNHVLVKSRERASKYREYKNEAWYKHPFK